MNNDSNATDISPLASALAGPADSGPASAVTDALWDEDSALSLLQQPDLPPDLIERLSKSSVTARSRKLKMAIVSHSKTPRYVSLSLIRKLFTFDLMQVALTPVVVGDLKVAAEETLINRLETISAGERLSLARRASGRVAGALLLAAEPRIVQAALENPRLTEALVIKVVLRDEASAALVRAVCAHSQWSLRREIRIALLRNRHTPPGHAVEFAKSLPNDVVREILRNSNLPEDVKVCLMESEP